MRPMAAVTTRPAAIVLTTATTSRHEASAIHRIVSTIVAVSTLLRTSPWAVLANSSSAIGTGPLTRVRVR